MKMMIVVVLALVAVACAVPVTEEEPKPRRVVADPIKILRSVFDQQPEGGYDFSFETENGIQQNQKGELKVVPDEDNKPHSVVIVRGSYSYTDSDGKVETVNYSADETGFHAEGDSIPTVAASSRR